MKNYNNLKVAKTNYETLFSFVPIPWCSFFSINIVYVSNNLAKNYIKHIYLNNIQEKLLYNASF